MNAAWHRASTDDAIRDVALVTGCAAVLAALGADR
jgi:hypothetical protein